MKVSFFFLKNYIRHEYKYKQKTVFNFALYITMKCCLTD